MKNPFDNPNCTDEDIKNIDPRLAWQWIKEGRWRLKDFQKWLDIRGESEYDSGHKDGESYASRNPYYWR